MGRMIYLDNAATTFPKPPAMLEKMTGAYSRLGVSPGRGSYDRAVQAEELVDSARRKLAAFFGAPDPARVVFAANATDALNLAIQGILQPGDHVVSSRLEHNSVLRPLNHLQRMGMIEYDLLPFNAQGIIDVDRLAAAFRSNTAAVIVSQASNVLGTVQPISEVAAICRRRGVPLIVDTAQSAGLVPIDLKSWGPAAVAFTGHKSLFGPTGIGGLAVHPDLDIRSTRFGGTGIDSGNPIHTQTFPHRLEAGTINLMGIIGLVEGVAFVNSEGAAAIHRREMVLYERLRSGLKAMGNVDIHTGGDLSRQLGLLTVNVRGMDPADVGAILDADFGIAVRTGLHCAPLVHKDLGTWPRGAVRFSLGPFNTDADIDQALSAMEVISQSAGSG